MIATCNILGIRGSLRRESYNRGAMRDAINQPEVMIANAAAKFDAAGTLTDGSTRDHIRALLQNLVEWTGRLRPGAAAAAAIV